jgi:gluconolactonase
MTLDEEGNLYLTGEGVDIYNKEGEHIQHLDVPEKWTANICFGGANNDEIFITASKGLYKLKMNVKGVR